MTGMSQTSREHHGDSDDEAAAELSVQQTEAAQDPEFDSLLDEIDGVLEANAEEFVRSFVQKGGE